MLAELKKNIFFLNIIMLCMLLTFVSAMRFLILFEVLMIFSYKESYYLKFGGFLMRMT